MRRGSRVLLVLGMIAACVLIFAGVIPVNDHTTGALLAGLVFGVGAAGVAFAP